ncbi:MAG TPA: response regulator transcription factor [Pseudonocardiaceae bacterium]|nr:response regulator transcription factor [Pseudonocardiaceae bacterium]
MADRALERGGLVALLVAEQGIRVVAQGSCVGQVVTMALRTVNDSPDVVVVDVDCDDALSGLPEVPARAPACKVVALTVRQRPSAIRGALDARAAGLVDKDAPPQAFVEAIRRVAAGHRVIDPNLAVAAAEAPSCPLTGREREVLRLFAAGSANSEIAAELCLSAGTVRNYVARVVRRLDAKSRIDAVRIAHQAGWV